MFKAFIINNTNLIIIGAIFVASVFGATVTTQILSTQKAEAGKYVCSWRTSRGCVQYKYVKTYECWKSPWYGGRTVCGWR